MPIVAKCGLKPSRIPSPEEIGLPEQFTSWRLNQEDAIYSGVYGTKRCDVISAPTGFGKQNVAIAIALLSGKATCIVTASKGLQDQYANIYKSIGMVDLRGRNNYICAMKQDDRYSCAEGYNARCVYKGTIACPASQAEMRAATSRLVVTNYDKWTYSKKYGQGMSHFQQVIFDEGHHMPDALARAMQVKLHYKEIEDTLGIQFLMADDIDNMREWKLWAAGAKAIAEEEMVATRLKIQSSHDPKPSWVRHYTHMRNLVRRLATISTASAKDWVVEQTEEGFQFDPIRPGKYAEATLLLKIPRVIALSATIRPKTMYMSGVGDANFNFHEFDSDFDPNRCPIYWVPTMRVDKHAGDLGLLWARLDQIAARRRDRKGIVHTISYDRQVEIQNRSRFRDSMILNERGEAPTQKINDFKDAGPGGILVSPSVGTGYDFPDDECRWQFVCKTPFEPPSKIQKARQADDKEYVYYRAMQYLVQAFGRDMRSKTDWSERFICDDHFGEWFKGRYGHLAPKSFHAVYKRVEILPQPLQL